MREILLDTEATGESPSCGHRLIEIACIEIFDRKTIGAQYHCYINPEMKIDATATDIHGLTTEFLLDKPVFHQIADGLMGFLGGSSLLANNVVFNMSFLDGELKRIGRDSISSKSQITDALIMAREIYPGKRNNLDDLCERLGVCYEHRCSVGALLDAELLADIYISLNSMKNMKGEG